MTTKITQKQRDAFVAAAMKEAFEPRFAALQAKIDELGAAVVAAQHPGFLKGRADPDVRPYVPALSSMRVRIGRTLACRPAQWSRVACDRRHYWTCKDGFDALNARVEAPVYAEARLDLSDYPDVLAEYEAAWKDFEAAQKTLTATIAAYSSRAKFESDFPGLVKYLPEPEKAAGTAVAVQVGDVMERLAKVGIPPEDGSVREAA